MYSTFKRVVAIAVNAQKSLCINSASTFEVNFRLNGSVKNRSAALTNTEAVDFFQVYCK